MPHSPNEDRRKQNLRYRYRKKHGLPAGSTVTDEMLQNPPEIKLVPRPKKEKKPPWKPPPGHSTPRMQARRYCARNGLPLNTKVPPETIQADMDLRETSGFLTTVAISLLAEAMGVSEKTAANKLYQRTIHFAKYPLANMYVPSFFKERLAERERSAQRTIDKNKKRKPLSKEVTTFFQLQSMQQKIKEMKDERGSVTRDDAAGQD